MSELDKYFEKARNVEPIYEEDDARKLLYGKLSDGGIATNLYNKIKVFPMITALITSVATFATIAFFSMSSPNEKVEQPNTKKHTSTNSVHSIIDKEEPNEKPEDLNWTEDKQPTSESSIALLSEKKQELNKKPKPLDWAEDKIDIKSVNSLKLTKDELAQLGIVIDDKSFKVNAFDKYTYTINQNNEKQRDYYDTEKDRDALPTPAMVTTSTGFKTLTLFKKGNVEATVDRYKSTSNGDIKSVTTNIEKVNKLDTFKISKESMINLDTNYNEFHPETSMNNQDTINKVKSHITIDTIGENEYVIRSDQPVQIHIPNRNPNMKVFSKEKYRIVGKDTIYEKESYINEINSLDKNSEAEKAKRKRLGIKTYYIENVSTLTINNVTLQDSNIIENKNSILESDEIDDKKLENMSFDIFNYNINELIPIEISFDGVNIDFIVWYEATDDFLSKLPTKIKAKINPELMALTEQMDHCENEPIEKKETVMDVWSGCSGAIKEMKVFPNPTTSNSNVEFELQDNRVISIAIFDLSGKLIKNVKSGMSLGKGNTKELLNLTGVNPGLYYVVVKSEKGEQALQRIIIE